MIVTDLDGTLLNDNGKPSFATKQYLMELKKQGYIIVIATGRIYSSILGATDKAEFANYLIADTGACTYQITGKPIFQNLISRELIQEILDYYNDEFCFIDICDKNIIYRYSKKVFHDNHLIKIITDKKDILTKNLNVSHISIAMNTNEAIVALAETLKRQFPELEILLMQDSFKDNKWLEITAKGISKYYAVKQLSEFLGIKNEEIIAFGDGLNDIEMIQNCGYGVAIKNALPEVKKVAQDITSLDHNHDGVIEYLKTIIDKK